MDKLRSTLKQFVRDWSAEVRKCPPFESGSASHQNRCRVRPNETPVTCHSSRHWISTFPTCQRSTSESKLPSSLIRSGILISIIRQDLKVLVPGTGLARLPYEVIQRGVCFNVDVRVFGATLKRSSMAGYTCQGNEFSHFMLLASYYILNRCDGF